LFVYLLIVALEKLRIERIWIWQDTKKLWEVFHEDPEMKNVFEKEYNAALKPGGDYIYYSHIKLTTPDIKSPKSSFIYGIPNWQWLVGAGVYLDEVETDIALIQNELHKQIMSKMSYYVLISIGVIAIFLFLFSRLNRGLENDFNLLISFFNRAALSNEPIDRNLVEFEELDRMAENANKMLQDKILAQQDLLDERERLFHSEAKFRGLVESSCDWIWEVNTENVYTYASPQVEAILGYKPEEVIGKHAFDFMPPEQAKQISAIFNDLVQSKKPIAALENINQHKDGHLVVLESSAVPIFDKTGKIIGYRGIDRDITERKKAEEDREQLIKTLEFKNKELQDIVYIASHDLRTPLVNIQGFSGELTTTCSHLLEMLDKHPAGPEQRQQIDRLLKKDIMQSLDFITKSADKMANLLDGLLHISRIGTVDIKRESLDINDIVAKVLTEMESQLKEKNIAVTIDPLPRCIGDANMVESVFTKLINNAVKYLEPGKKGEIRISGTVQGDMSFYCVQDNGIGISPAHQENIFKLFHRLSPHDKVGGVGMGLTIVRRILDRLRGRIWLESEPGKGSKFFLALAKG